MSAFGFANERDHRRMSDAVRDYERNRGKAGKNYQLPRGAVPLFARSTGTVVDTDFASGFIVIYDSDGNATDGSSCYLTTIDDEPPPEGIYFGRITNSHLGPGDTAAKPVVRIVEDSSDPDDCGYLVGLDSADCLSAEVYQASGRCSDVPVDQHVTLEWDAGDSRWESADNIVVKPVDDVADPVEGPLAYWVADGRPRLAILEADAVHYEFRYLGCIDGKDTFAGGGPLLCDGTGGATCDDNTIRIRVGCAACIGDDIQTACQATAIPALLCMTMTPTTGPSDPVSVLLIHDGDSWVGTFADYLHTAPGVPVADHRFVFSALTSNGEGTDCFRLQEIAIFSPGTGTSGGLLCGPGGLVDAHPDTVTESPFEADFTAAIGWLCAFDSGGASSGSPYTATIIPYAPAGDCDNGICAECPEGFPTGGFNLNVPTVTGDAGYATLEGVFSLFGLGGCDFASATTGDRWELTAGGDLVGTTSGGATVTFTRAADLNCCGNSTFVFGSASGTFTAPTSLTITADGECGPDDEPPFTMCAVALDDETHITFVTDAGEVSVLWNATTQVSDFTNSGIASGYVRFKNSGVGTPQIEWWDDLPENGGTVQAFFDSTVAWECEGTCFIANFGPGFSADSAALAALFNDATPPIQVIPGSDATGTGWPYGPCVNDCPGWTESGFYCATDDPEGTINNGCDEFLTCESVAASGRFIQSGPHASGCPGETCEGG